MMKTVIVKLGTNAMTSGDGLDLNLLDNLVRQLAEVYKENNLLFVTSGAMGCGKSILKKEMRYDEVTNRQLYAVVGQVKLMEIYSNLFDKYGFKVAQMLTTKQDFTNRSHSLNTKNCIDSLFREKILPIMNENDFVCVEELMFTDNDELSSFASKMLFADHLILLTNVEGVLDNEGKVINEFNYDDEIPTSIVAAGKSSFGKGGMQSKFKVATTIAGEGTKVTIANSRTENVILRVVAGENIGTTFKPKVHA